MMAQQELRNALTEIEDSARPLRAKLGAATPAGQLAGLVARLAQIVRQEIVQ